MLNLAMLVTALALFGSTGFAAAAPRNPPRTLVASARADRRWRNDAPANATNAAGSRLPAALASDARPVKSAAAVAPGQLKNSAFINRVPNPFSGIPPGQLKKMRMVDNIENPFFDEAPGHWEIPEWGVPDEWPSVPEFDDFFGLPSEQFRPEQLLNSATINGVRNPFLGIPPGQLKKLPTVQGYENPFFDELPGHWAIP